jgi:GNAT superfamily N-acetyltransferase
VDVVEVTEGEPFARWHAAMKAALERTSAPEDYVDWRRQADDMVWLLGSEDGEDVAAGIALVGWHSPPHLSLADVRVPPAARGRGHGRELLERLSAWAAERGATELEGDVWEDDPASLAWAERQGFREVGRNSRLALDLTEIEPPEQQAPPGIEIATWAERPDAVPGMYEVACEAMPDIPGNEDSEVGTLEEWLSRDMQGSGDRPEATFVAYEGDRVVGYAKLAFSGARPHVVMHDLTGVLRSERGRGIAAALKRTQIRWAKEHGYEKLETSNEVRNEPIRRLNERHGYRLEPGEIKLRGPLATG